MEINIERIADALKDAGCTSCEIDVAKKLFETEQTDELIRHFKKCRCVLMEEMHESQRKVDRMDFLIWNTEKIIR
jgi:hypothetical protein